MDASDITRTPQSSGAMSPAAAIAAAFAAAAAHQQQDAAVTPNYQAASATPWGAQIATPRNFQGRAVAVTKTQVAAKTQGAAQQVAGASFNPLTGDAGLSSAGAAGLSSAGAAGLSSAGTAALSSARAPRTTLDWGGAPQIEMTAQDPAANGGSGVDLIFDEEAQRQDETLRQRNEALVSNVIALQQGSLTSFSLV